jgi:O-antigen/teichoic acid export membrane protein
MSATALSGLRRKMARHVMPIANFSSRLVGLMGRFVLAIYMARFFPLDQIGLFGLIAGAAGLMPSITGLGLNYFLSREIVDKTEVEAGILIRDRLAVTILVLCSVFVACLIASATGLMSLPQHMWIIATIIVFDTIAFDLHMSLISLRKSVLANMLLSIRSGLWVFPALVLGILHPYLRSLECILHCWLGGLATYFIVLGISFRRWPFRAIASIGVNWVGSYRIVTRGWLIYASDIGLAGSLYIDRYVVDHFLGLSETGLYTLYWTIANGVHLLITAAVVQPVTPLLISALKRSEGEWYDLLQARFVNIITAFVPFSVMVYFAAIYVLPHFGVAKLSAEPLLLALILGSMLIRLFADNMNSALYTRKMDFEFSILNLTGLCIAFFTQVVMLKCFGLIGAGLAAIVTSTVLFFLRWKALEMKGVTNTVRLSRKKLAPE